MGPLSQEVLRLLEDLCAAINDVVLPPVIQAGLVHAQFEVIHPFLDGNGCTGRALIHVVLRRRGLTPMYVPPISVVLAGDKGAYIAGLDAYARGDSAAWALIDVMPAHPMISGPVAVAATGRTKAVVRGAPPT